MRGFNAAGEPPALRVVMARGLRLDHAATVPRPLCAPVLKETL